jgi:hypothetical protein
MAGQKSKKVKDENLDPVERVPFEQRRGTLKAWDYDSWEAASIHVGGKKGLDAVIEKLAKAKKVGVVEKDVTKAALAGKLAQPDAPHVVIVKLRGHDWALLYVSFAESYVTDPYKEISKDAGTKIIWCGHQDTAGATGFQLFDRGEQTVQFETCGYSDGEDDDDMFGTRFTSKFHKKDWWKSHEHEDQTLQTLVKEQDAYVPWLMGGAEKGKLSFAAMPEDTLDAANVERVVMAVYGPAKKAKPSAEGKQLLEAIKKLDVKGVEAALAVGADQNYLPGENDTALACAVNAALRDPDRGIPVIEALISGGANVNDAGPRGNYPIWEALEGVQGRDKKLPIMLRLIEAGADVNAISRGGSQKGSRMLHFVAVCGDVEMAKFLLAHGADVKLKDERGETPAKNARGVIKSMEKMIDDEDGEHTGPLKVVIELLEQVEKGKLKAKDFSKDPSPVIKAERKRNEKLRAEIHAAFEKAGNAISTLAELEAAEKANDKKRMKHAAAKAANLAQPATIKIKKIADSPSRWDDPNRRDTVVAALKGRGFEPIGEFQVTGQEFLNMVALLHPEKHVYAAVCEMLNNQWVDLVQYYTNDTQLEVTNVRSAPESWVDVPGRTKIRQPKWGVTKLAEHILKAEPPSGAKVRKLQPMHFARDFERDYLAEMRFRRKR